MRYALGFVVLMVSSALALGSDGGSAAATVESMLRVELETYYVVDERLELRGTIRVTDPKGFYPAVGQRPDRSTFRIKVTSLTPKSKVWETSVPVGAKSQSEYPFTVPVPRLVPGYNRLEVMVGPSEEGEAKTSAGRFPPLGKGGPIADFAILEKRQPAPKPRLHDDPETYLAFVVDTIEQLIRHQSCRLGGEPNGVRFITVTGRESPSRRSIGVRNEETKLYRSITAGGQHPEFHEPYGADLDAWHILDLLSQAADEPKYAQMVTEMAEVFAIHGFDPRSGLGYLGEEAQLDVLRLRPICTRRQVVSPLFKPGLSDNTPDLPLDRLWKHAPKQMSRMFKAAFYGLVTNPEGMDYNRYCHYDFDDQDRKPSMQQHGYHLGFDSAGGRLIQWWGSCFAHTGDRECLDWAQTMADKWQAVQHPQSGLVPYFFGGNYEGTAMPPVSFAEIRGGSMCALALLKAAEEFRKRPEGRPLAEQLTQMGLKLARGTARYGYDPQERRFHKSLTLDGTARPSTSRYTFSTQQEKDEAVKLDPKMCEVPVFAGLSFYLKGPYWRYTTGTPVPYQITMGAWLTKDPELLERVKYFAEQVMQESREVTSAFTPEGKWTFYATGQYVRMLALLYQMTDDQRYLQWARTLADREIDHLDKIAYPEWWRMRERSAFLEALLKLYDALQTESGPSPFSTADMKGTHCVIGTDSGSETRRHGENPSGRTDDS